MSFYRRALSIYRSCCLQGIVEEILWILLVTTTLAEELCLLLAVYKQASSDLSVLHLSTTDLLNQVILCGGSCPLPQDYGQHPWPLPLDASMPLLTTSTQYHIQK